MLCGLAEWLPVLLARAPHGHSDDARRRLGNEGDGAGERGGLAGIDANGHEACAYRRVQDVDGKCRPVAAPVRGRLCPAVAERSIVVVHEVQTDQLALAVPGQAAGRSAATCSRCPSSGARWPRRRDRGRAATGASWSGRAPSAAKASSSKEDGRGAIRSMVTAPSACEAPQSAGPSIRR